MRAVGQTFAGRAFVTLCADFDFIELPVNNAHAVMAGEFRLLHKNPFDRVLAAQAIVEGVALVTDDSGIEVLGRRWCGPEHRDPFDRMLAAQALVEGLTLAITYDMLQSS